MRSTVVRLRVAWRFWYWSIASGTVTDAQGGIVALRCFSADAARYAIRGYLTSGTI